MNGNVEELTAPKQKHGLLAVSLITTSMALILISVAVIVAVFRPAPWNPLGEYADQIVSNRLAGRDGPAVLATDKVIVTGTKCAKTNVTVRGGAFWQSVDVAGTLIPSGYPPGD